MAETVIRSVSRPVKETGKVGEAVGETPLSLDGNLKALARGSMMEVYLKSSLAHGQRLDCREGSRKATEGFFFRSLGRRSYCAVAEEWGEY